MIYDGKSAREINQRIVLSKTTFSTKKDVWLNMKKKLIKTYVWSVAKKKVF